MKNEVLAFDMDGDGTIDEALVLDAAGRASIVNSESYSGVFSLSLNNYQPRHGSITLQKGYLSTNSFS